MVGRVVAVEEVPPQQPTAVLARGHAAKAVATALSHGLLGARRGRTSGWWALARVAVAGLGAAQRAAHCAKGRGKPETSVKRAYAWSHCTTEQGAGRQYGCVDVNAKFQLRRSERPLAYREYHNLFVSARTSSKKWILGVSQALGPLYLARAAGAAPGKRAGFGEFWGHFWCSAHAGGHLTLGKHGVARGRENNVLSPA